MKYLKVEKTKLAGFLDKLAEESRVIAPVADEGRVVFKEVRSGQAALSDFANSTKSPKEHFFPQAETLFSFRLADGKPELDEPAPESRRTVIFGMRPCDARALLALDEVFLQEACKDSGYAYRRQNTIVLALGCPHPRSTCFCTSVGGGPFSTDGADALFVDTGESYVVELLTPRGEEIFKDSGFPEADEESLRQARQVKKQAEAAMKSTVNAAGAARLDVLEIFNSKFWDGVHEKCLGCGICTYVCPTCSCFDVVDEKAGAGGERIRIWDTCQFPQYTLQASGFNPRPSGKERMRQRVLHKFKYSPDTCGRPSCVGCGRCVLHCPVNLDIRQVVNSLVGGKG